MEDSFSQERATAGGEPFVLSPARSLASARRWAAERASALMCAALLALMAAQMLSVVAAKSITIDEIVMIPSAYYHLAAGNFQLVNEHPPLSKIVAGVPLLFIQPDELRPEKLKAPPNSREAKWMYQERFWEDNPKLFEQISFWARVPMIALTVALGALLFLFARELFGERAALFAVALFAVEPTVLAHGRVVQTDVPAAFGYLLLFYALMRYSRGRTWRGALAVGASAGVAILAKYSMLLAGPVLAVFFAGLLWRERAAGRERLKRIVAHAALAAAAIPFVINAAYFFRHRALTEADARWIRASFGASSGAVLGAVDFLSYILPADFVLGIFFQLWHNGQGHNAGLLGMHGSKGWWYYFPVAFSLKTTLPFLLLSLAALAWGARAWFKRREARFLWALAPFAAYTAFVLLSNINIGVRYYLPAYTFLFVLAGALVERLFASRKSGRAGRAGALAAAALLCWMCVEAVRAYPDHMTYMNQLASRAPAWWYLSDSNVEWGDDVRSLALYLKARGEKSVRGAFLGGFLTLHHYGVGYEDALPDPKGKPTTRYTAVGASFLNGSTVALPPGPHGSVATEQERVNAFDEYRHREPERIFGGSIYLFREDVR